MRVTRPDDITLIHQPIIFIAGMPRSGSMWTYNVCRRLILATGRTPWPDSVPQDETAAIQHALVHPPGPDQIYCIKSHKRIPVELPHMRIICNYRDIRNAMLSYMRFMKCPFDKALAVARGSMDLTDHYLARKHSNVHAVRYDTLVEHPRETIGELADFLSLPASQADIGRIASALSRDEVRRHVEQLESSRADAENRGPGSLSTVENLDGSRRIYDHATGFQSGHISSGREGEWRDAFTAEQQAQVMAAAADWLTRYEFRH